MIEQENLNLLTEFQGALSLLAKEKSLTVLVEGILSKIMHYSLSKIGVVLFIEEDNIVDLQYSDLTDSIKNKEEIESEIKKDFLFLFKWIETNKKPLIGSADKNNIAQNMTRYLNSPNLLIIPVFFDERLFTVLILGRRDKKYKAAEIKNIEQLSFLLSYAVNNIKTKKLNAALQTGMLQSQKLETIGKLASGMAHDFSNILSSIFGSLNLLKKKMAPTEDAMRLLENIENCSVRAKDLTKSLLSFGKPTVKKQESVGMNILFEEINKVINQTFPKEINFINLVKPELYTVLGVSTEIYQALLNLCVNAKEAMDGKGELTVFADNIFIDDMNNYLYPFLNKGEYVYLSVKDTGTGITEENIRKIFNPYFSTKKKETGSGSGLGLYVTYRIIKEHNGFINVESEVGKGTKFNVYLPSYDPMKKETPKSTEKIIMIADDEIMLRDLLAELLESAGYSVIKVISGKEALKVLTEEIKIDLLIIDYNMPEMNGIECIKRLHELNLNFPVILSTGSLTLNNKYEEEIKGIHKIVY